MSDQTPASPSHENAEFSANIADPAIMPQSIDWGFLFKSLI